MARKFNKGSVLVVVLFVMAVLGLTAVSFAYRANLQSMTARNQAILIKLRSHAYSAIAIAIGRLKENTNDFDHRAEPWFTHVPVSSEDWLLDWSAPASESGFVFQTTYSVIDEESKLNLLFASSEALEKLGLKSSQVDSFFDWIDEDTIARPEGAEHEYYLSLARPYRCKNKPLDLLDELMLIRGFSVSDYLGEDSNHNGRLDQNENDGSLSHPADNADGQLDIGLVDLLTCCGDGRINLNTAPRPVLSTLPISEEAVEQIIAYRQFDSDSSGDLREHAFTSDSDIEQLQGLYETDRDVLKSFGAFRSRHFRIFARSVHEVTGLHCEIEALVRFEGEEPEILTWRVGT